MTATRTDESVLEALDFDHEVPCELTDYGWHDEFGDGPAVYLLIGSIPCRCAEDKELTVCQGCWAAMRGVHCTHCGAEYVREHVWRIVRVIGGAS
jgi:hypothetical protein